MTAAPVPYDHDHQRAWAQLRDVGAYWRAVAAEALDELLRHSMDGDPWPNDGNELSAAMASRNPRVIDVALAVADIDRAGYQTAIDETVFAPIRFHRRLPSLAKDGQRAWVTAGRAAWHHLAGAGLLAARDYLAAALIDPFAPATLELGRRFSDLHCAAGWSREEMQGGRRTYGEVFRRDVPSEMQDDIEFDPTKEP